MNQNRKLSRAEELEKEIAALPSGSISKKKINGKEYFYYRWTEDKKRREKYVSNIEAERLIAQIELRKRLQTERKMLSGIALESQPGIEKEQQFSTVVLTGKRLRAFSASVLKYKKRECFRRLYEFIYGETQDRVFILYGLRRTGKTTMIRQLLAQMNDEELEKVAFIQINEKNTLADINRDLVYLEEQGYLYVFIDEVTMMEDFIEGAALFSDIFAACGMKIVLSGTDSLGFIFTEDEQLYDRCVLLHTTFIPYREFETVLGIRGIDEYIRYGGTMSLGGVHYNQTSTFATKKRADEYVDTAIAHNIQHSLRCYQHGNHFRNLRELYEENELTSVINRVVEDINHRFTLDVLDREFRSGDLAISAGNLRRDREHPTDILDRVDLSGVTDRLRRILEIRNREERKTELAEIHASEIREYLQLLDLVQEIGIRSLPDVSRNNMRTVITQPGLRYAQANALIDSLLQDAAFSGLTLIERNSVQERILNEIKGRMMEDIVLLETTIACPEKQVFVLQFPVGEFDMVVFDPEKASCELYEIKHSREAVPQQYRHLKDEEKCRATEHRYGMITGKYVLYRGEDQEIDGIQYKNIEDWLKKL